MHTISYLLVFRRHSKCGIHGMYASMHTMYLLRSYISMYS